LNPLDHSEIEELLGAFALDALESEEHDVIDSHVAGCPRCRAEVATHRETAALLAHPGAPAPDGVWDRIAATLDEAPPDFDLTRLTPLAGSRRRSVSLRMAVAAVAVAAVLTAFFGIRVGRQDARLAAVSDRVNEVLRTEGPRGSALAAMADPDAEEVRLTSFDGKWVARVVRLPDGTGYLVADSLARLPSERSYQLWALRQGANISLGVLGGDPDVSSFHLIGPVLGYAITDEVAQGVASTGSPPVVVGWMQAAEDARPVS
jgi:anti-sigma-K factor RskA/putative zinc finger protein